MYTVYNKRSLVELNHKIKTEKNQELYIPSKSSNVIKTTVKT